MLTQIKANFLSENENSFVNKDGEKVRYKKVCIMCADDNKPLTLSADTELDFSFLDQFQEAHFTLNLYSDNSGYLKGKIVGIDL